MHASAGKHKRDNALEARLIPGRISCCPMTCVKIIEAVHHFHKPFGASQAMLQFITRSHPLKYTAQCRRNLNNGCFSLTPPHAVKLGCYLDMWWSRGKLQSGSMQQGISARKSRTQHKAWLTSYSSAPGHSQWYTAYLLGANANYLSKGPGFLDPRWAGARRAPRATVLHYLLRSSVLPPGTVAVL